MYELRKYQKDAIAAAKDYLFKEEGKNPVVVLPTGAGKSIVLAQICKDFIEEYFEIGIIILAHVKELVKQNYGKFNKLMKGEFEAGICCASLNRKDLNKQITFASIQSVFRRVDGIREKHLIIVDEAHHINVEDEGMYRQFIEGMKKRTNVKVLGLTATPYRTKDGNICGPDYIFNDICYEAKIPDLIAQGYLSPLTNKVTESSVDLSKIHIKRGDFDVKELDEFINKKEAVKSAVEDIINKSKEKKHCVVFCINIKHAENICEELKDLGESAEIIHSKISEEARDSVIDMFHKKEIKYLVNVNVLTEGFDAPFIDCVVLLRPTMSPGLYYQMVGRGFRIAEGKKDCLVLDYGENILRHGCIDQIETQPKVISKKGQAPVKKCPKCFTVVHAAKKECQECGYIFEIKDETKHKKKADSLSSILSSMNGGEKFWVKINKVSYLRHQKTKDKPATLRVIYNSLINWYNEFLCFEHPEFSFPREKADAWWHRRSALPLPRTVGEALGLIKKNGIREPEEILVKKNGKWWEILDYKFKGENRPEKLEQEEMELDDEVPY